MSKKCIALGSFDGLHKGHQAVIDTAREGGYDVTLVTFETHPAKFFSDKKKFLLLNKNETDKKLNKENISVERLNLAEISDYSPEEFFEKIILKKLSADKIACGKNYTFGKNKEGNVFLLERLCKKHGVVLAVAPDTLYDGEIISSTRIREAIKAGKIELANELLGYRFSYKATVIEGDKRGGEILNFPTANQLYPEHLIVPKYGVYKSTATVNSKEYKSITNIGMRPTIGTKVLLSETHILDFSENIYGCELEIRLEKFIREEKGFSSLDELKEQIKLDIEESYNGI